MTDTEIQNLIDYVRNKEHYQDPIDFIKVDSKTFWGRTQYRTSCIELCNSLFEQPVEKQYHTIIHEVLHFVIRRINGRSHNWLFKDKETEYLKSFGIVPIRHKKAVHVSALSVKDKIVWVSKDFNPNKIVKAKQEYI